MLAGFDYVSFDGAGVMFAEEKSVLGLGVRLFKILELYFSASDILSSSD